MPWPGRDFEAGCKWMIIYQSGILMQPGALALAVVAWAQVAGFAAAATGQVLPGVPIGNRCSQPQRWPTEVQG